MSTELFIEAAGAGDLSVGLIGTWVQIDWFRVEPEKPGGKPQLAAATTGLARYVGREIDFMPSDLKASQIAERILYVSRYMICEGPSISDHDTLGSEDWKALSVRLMDQGYRPGIPVFALDPSVGQKLN